MLRFLPEFSRLSCVFPDMKFCRNRHFSTRRKKPSWRRIFILSVVLNCLNIGMIFFLYFSALCVYVFIAAHVPWRWTTGSFLSNWALWSSLQEFYSFLCRWATTYWKLQTPQNDWKGEFCKSKAGEAHPHRQRGKVVREWVTVNCCHWDYLLK